MKILDILLHIIHLAIIGFCLFGWIFPAMRPWHLMLCLLTMASWFVLGFFIKNPGYCLVTGIQQKLRKKIAPEDEMKNYMHFLFKKISARDVSESKIDLITQVFLYGLTAVSIFLNYKAGFFTF